MATTDSNTIGRPPPGKVQLRRPRAIPSNLVEFQPDAVEIEKRSVPGGARWTLYTVVALIAAAIGWACWAQVDKIVIAQGQLVATEPPIVIQPLSAAPIREILVRFGDVVYPNDILATFDRTFSEADVAIYRAKVDSLTAALARLTAERDGLEFQLTPTQISDNWRSQRRAFSDRKLEHAAKLASFVAEQGKLEAQQGANDEKIVTIQGELDVRQRLHEKLLNLRAKDVTSEVELMSAAVELRRTEQSLAEAGSQKVQLHQDLELNAKRRDEYIAHRNAEISQEYAKVQTELSQATEELNKANRINEYVDLRVPADLPHPAYFVLEVAERSAGSVPQSSESLFKLVPLDVAVNGLVAEFDVESRDIGLIRQGDTARIKLDSFPYQKHGTLEGKVRTISEGTFVRGEGPSSKIMYKARASLGSADRLKNMPEPYRLLPGMTVAVEIVVGKRRVIEYFLYPLIRNLDSATREP